MGYAFEFDSVNKLLLLRFDGRLTDELYAEAYSAAKKHWAATDAKMGIVDFTPVTDFAASPQFLRQLVNREPVGDAAKYPRVAVCPNHRSIWTSPHVPNHRRAYPPTSPRRTH